MGGFISEIALIFFVSGFDAISCKKMAKVVKFFLEKGTLTFLKLKIGLFESI